MRLMDWVMNLVKVLVIVLSYLLSGCLVLLRLSASSNYVWDGEIRLKEGHKGGMEGMMHGGFTVSIGWWMVDAGCLSGVGG